VWVFEGVVRILWGMFVGCRWFFGGVGGCLAFWVLLISGIVEVLSSTVLEFCRRSVVAVNFEDPADIGCQVGTGF